MKLRGLVAMLLLLAAPVMAQPPGVRQPAPKGPRPVIEIPKMMHDFGEIYRQDKYIHAFAVNNKGDVDLLIEDVKPG